MSSAPHTATIINYILSSYLEFRQRMAINERFRQKVESLAAQGIERRKEISKSLETALKQARDGQFMSLKELRDLSGEET